MLFNVIVQLMSRRLSPEEGRRLRLLIPAGYLNRLSLSPLNLKQIIKRSNKYEQILLMKNLFKTY